MKTLTKQFITVTLGLLLISGCSPKNTEESIKSAQQYLSEGETEAAVIELKNAVSSNLKDPAPRLLIAQVYIEIGDLTSAVKELLKARELGANENEVLPFLAISYYHMEEFESATELYFNAIDIERNANSTLALYAFISSLRDSVEGNDIQLSDILSILNDQDQVIANAVKQIEQRNNQSAIELLHKYQSTNNLSLVHYLKGLAYFYDDQLSKAIESLIESEKLMPVINSSSYLLANAYLKEEDFEKAYTQVTKILKASPRNIAAMVIKAKAEYGLKNYEGAALAAENAIQYGSRSNSVRAIAGVSNFILGKKERAYSHLNAIYTNNALPKELYRLLAELQIELGYGNQAKKLLANVEKSSADDANYFAQIGLDFAKEGDMDSARNLLGKASAAAPQDPLIKLQKAVVDLAVEPKKSIQAFEDVIEADPSLDIAWVYLAISKLDNQNLEEALAVAAEWKLTNELDGTVLEGVLYDKSGNNDKAELAYKYVLSMDEAHNGANIYLSSLYDRTDRKKEAFDLATKALLLGANNQQLIPLVLRLGVNTQQHTRSVETFKTLYNEDNQNPNSLVAYGAALRLAGEIQQAADLLSKNTDLLNGFGFVTLGDSYIDLRDYSKALNAFQMWRENIPKDPGGYLRAIGLMMIGGELTPAMNLIDTAEKRFPNQVRFKYLKLQQLIVAKRFAEANDYLEILKKLGENSITLIKMEGDLAFAKGNFELSETLRMRVVESQNSFNNVYALALALEKQSKNKQALAVIETTLSDTTFTNSELIELASLYSEIEEYNKAKQSYLKLLDINPKNSVWLNNLANVQIELNDLNAATKNAQAALENVGTSTIFIPYIKATQGRIEFLKGNFEASYEKQELALKDLSNENSLILDFMETLLSLKFYEKFDEWNNKIRVSDEKDKTRLKYLIMQRGQ